MSKFWKGGLDRDGRPWCDVTRPPGGKSRHSSSLRLADGNTRAAMLEHIGRHFRGVHLVFVYLYLCFRICEERHKSCSITDAASAWDWQIEIQEWPCWNTLEDTSLNNLTLQKQSDISENNLTLKIQSQMSST